MIDIFNERTYITNILKSGFNPNKWKRDADIYVRFFKEMGNNKKREVRAKLIEKCALYVPGFNIDNPYFKKTIDIIMRKSWDKFKPLRCLKPIVVNRQIIDYFLNLPVKREERNLLFGLYVWVQISRQYMSYFPETPKICIDNDQKKFKEWNNIKQSTNILNLERNLNDYISGNARSRGKLDRRGYRHYSYYIYPDFINKNAELFLVEEQKTKDIRDIIPLEEQIEMSYEDMMATGVFLEKQDKGTFICVNCGKEEIYNNKDPRTRKRQIYCKECAFIKKQEQTHKSVKAKRGTAPKEIRTCSCGNEFEVFKTSKRLLCDTCYKEHRLMVSREANKARRNKKKI